MLNLLVLFVGSFHPFDSQEQPSFSPQVETVLERFIRAKGGRDTLKKIKNYRLEGELFVDQRRIARFEIYQAPGRHLSITRFSEGTTRRHGTDGKTVWQIDEKGNPSILSGEEARDYLRHHESLHESLEWRNQFVSIQYAGKKTIETKPTHHLVFLASDQRQIHRYFSIESGLLIREEQMVGSGKKSQLMISKIGDYRKEENGTLVSRNRQNFFGSPNPIEYRVTKVESNRLAEEEVFRLPNR